MYEKSDSRGKYLAKNTNSLAHVQKIPFTEQITWKKLVITLICKLKLKN